MQMPVAASSAPRGPATSKPNADASTRAAARPAPPIEGQQWNKMRRFIFNTEEDIFKEVRRGF